MKRSFILIAVLVISLAAAARLPAQDSNADSRPGFGSFQVIERNNIFNPNRRPPRTDRRSQPQVRIYTFTLNGTMTYENKGYAFFGGNGVNRSQPFAPADSINGYKIAEITNNTVKLAAASNEFITLKVGMQMRKEENGPWKLVASSVRDELPASSGSTDASSDDNSGDSAAARTPSISGPDADVIKRLMHRRAEESGDTNAATPNTDSNQ
jgi:hypothetical protein